MKLARYQLLIAAPAAVIRELGSVLRDEADPVGVETFDEAVARLGERDPDVLVLCYAFDQVRPFRLLNYLRQEWPHAHVPTILVRALPVPMGETEEGQIRDSYKTLGVDVFFNLHDEGQRNGREAALRQFQDAVLRLLPRKVPAAGA
jgi:CheY-like chemotaxis protein